PGRRPVAIMSEGIAFSQVNRSAVRRDAMSSKSCTPSAKVNELRPRLDSGSASAIPESDRGFPFYPDGHAPKPGRPPVEARNGAATPERVTQVVSGMPLVSRVSQGKLHPQIS